MEHVDYEALCRELFRTTDVSELKKIAAHVNQKNRRKSRSIGIYRFPYPE